MASYKWNLIFDEDFIHSFAKQIIAQDSTIE